MRQKVITMRVFLYILLMTSTVQSAFAAEEVFALRRKNHFALMRHAFAPGTGDPIGFKRGDCSTQRNLSAKGRAQAQEIGKNLVSKLGKDFWVFTSSWCRCEDTARYLGGRKPVNLPALDSFFQNSGSAGSQTEQLKAWLKQNLSRYNPLVLVTHQVNITELTGIFPAEGELLIFRMDEDGRIFRVEEK